MKQLVWAAEAAADLEHIADYLFKNAPERAAVLVHRIYAATQGLPAFPRRGRPGRIEGTREMVLTPLPYLVIYRISDDVIQVLRILHGAQKWP